jgi:hypothetical protein
VIKLRHARGLHGSAAVFAAAGLIAAAIAVFASGGPSGGNPPAMEQRPEGFGTALFVAEGEAGPLTRFVAAIELVRSSRETLVQAESLRGTAARFVQIARENVEARKDEPDPAALESARYLQIIAESQLALAEDLRVEAGTMAEGAQVIFETARRNAMRLEGDDEEAQEPGDFVRPDAADVVRSVRSPAAARRNRRA